MSETVRTVKTEFTAEDKGLGAHQARLSAGFEHGAKHLEGFREKLREFRREQGLTTIAALGLGYGLGSWIEKAKEGNAEFEKTRKGIAGVLAGALDFGKGTSEIDRYNRSLKLSGEITDQVEDTAARFSMQFEDVAEVYKKVALSAGALGLKQKQVMDLTTNASASAAHFQISGEEAVNTVVRAMRTGGVRAIDGFGIALDQALKKMGNLKKMSQEQRFEVIQKALTGSVQIADVMAGGVGGSLIRIRNEVSKTFRELTSPIFGEIGKRLEAWGKHIRDARAGAKPLIEEFSGKLLTAFRTMADIMGVIREHWMSIGAVVAGMKIGALAKGIGGALGGAGAALGGAGPLGYVGGALGGMGGIFGKIGAVAPALGGIVTAAALAAIALKGVYDDWQGKKKQASELGGFFSEMGKISSTQDYLRKHNAGLTPDQVDAGKAFSAAHADAAAEILKQKGLFENGAIAMGKFNDVVDAMSDDIRKKFATSLGLGGLGDVSSGMLGAAAAEMFQRTYRAPGSVSDSDKDKKFAKQVINNNFAGGIHIQWKNEETDPDRAFLRFTDKFENYIHKKTQAYTAEALGD